MKFTGTLNWDNRIPRPVIPRCGKGSSVSVCSEGAELHVNHQSELGNSNSHLPTELKAIICNFPPTQKSNWYNRNSFISYVVVVLDLANVFQGVNWKQINKLYIPWFVHTI